MHCQLVCFLTHWAERDTLWQDSYVDVAYLQDYEAKFTEQVLVELMNQLSVVTLRKKNKYKIQLHNYLQRNNWHTQDEPV